MEVITFIFGIVLFLVFIITCLIGLFLAVDMNRKFKKWRREDEKWEKYEREYKRKQNK
jgi:hypothetical protein